MTSVSIDKQRLAECSFCFFGVMAKTFGEHYSPYLEATVESLFRACQIEEVDEFENEEILNVEDGENHLSGYAINNAIAELKETAVDALGVVFESTARHFSPYFERTLNIVQELSDNGHEGVRKSCSTTFFRMLATLWRSYQGESKWTPGLPVTYTVHNDVMHLVKIVMDESMKTYDEEEDKSVVCSLNMEIIDGLKLLGPALVAGHIEILAAHILSLLQKKATCQAEADDEEDVEEDEDQAEYDALVISTTADLIGTLAEALGERFITYFDRFWPFINKYYKPSKPVSERSMAIGVIGEVASGLKGEVTRYTPVLLICGY